MRMVVCSLQPWKPLNEGSDHFVEWIWQTRCFSSKIVPLQNVIIAYASFICDAYYFGLVCFLRGKREREQKKPEKYLYSQNWQ